ncbi:MAG: heme-binding protein [Halobacteria archaeon]
MVIEEPRDKAEGWYVLHDLRDFDFREWSSLDRKTRESITEEAAGFFEEQKEVDHGSSALFSVLGNEADLMQIYVRPTVEELDQVTRKFESLRLGGYTEEKESHLSVTEVGGVTNEEVEEGDVSNYIEGKLYFDIPDKKYVSFYPMSRKRDADQNWYEQSLEKRGEMMKEHRRSGEKYADKIKQLVSGSVGLDNWEWGVDLFTDDLIHAKHIVYEMRFDEASARYSEFGPFYTGVRFEPDKLGEFVEGESLESEDAQDEQQDIRDELEEEGVYAGKPHGEDVHALVLYSTEDSGDLYEEVEGMRGNFDRYDTHVETSVYNYPGDEVSSAIVSIWDTADAAETAASFLVDMPGVVERAGEDDTVFETMGMFYTVKPEFKNDFDEKFDEVGGLLEDMEGHIQTVLLENVEDKNDMFIDSRWESKEEAMEFFRSSEFTDTVNWGREVLDDKPRHVFLA